MTYVELIIVKETNRMATQDGKSDQGSQAIIKRSGKLKVENSEENRGAVAYTESLVRRLSLVTTQYYQ